MISLSDIKNLDSKRESVYLKRREGTMIILNTLNGAFDNRGELQHSKWPDKGYQLCPRENDQQLFAFLEKANWGNGRVLAATKWMTRTNDEPHNGPTYKAGTFSLKGSGICFHHCSSTMITRASIDFLCELIWDKIFDKEGRIHTRFFGPEHLVECFRKSIADVHEENTKKNTNLMEQLRRNNEQMERLMHATT